MKIISGVKIAVAIFALFFCLSINPGKVEATATSSITQNGITWTFDNSYTYGQFANGDFWVLSPVTITSITPDFTGTMHGWEVNPTANAGNGFDTGVIGFSATLVPTLPYTATTTQSIVKAVSRTGSDRAGGCENAPNGDERNCLKTASVLTVLSSVPANDGATVFRPPYIGSIKPLYSTTDVNYGLLPTLALPASVSGYTHSWVINNIPGPYLDHVGVTLAQQLHPKDYMPAYGGNFSVLTTNLGLALTAGSSTPTKTLAVNKYIQVGIDLYHQMISGVNWFHNGGHSNGRFLPIMYAAVLLNNSAMLSTLSTISSNQFGESSVLYWTEKPYGSGRKVLFGDPSVNELDYWKLVAATGDSGGISKTAIDPYKMIDGNRHPGSEYQEAANSMVWKGITIALRLLPQTLDKAPFIERFNRYSDRWVNVGAWAQPDVCAPYDGNFANYGVTFGPNGSGGCIEDSNAGNGTGRFPTYHGNSRDTGGYQTAMGNAMWTDYNGTLSDLTPPLVFGASPTTTLAASVNNTNISISTDESATCKYSTVAATAYSSMTAFSTTGGTTHTSNISGLTPDTTYTYYVKCQDPDGNTNTENYSFSFSINNAYSLSDFLILHYTFDNANMISSTVVDDISPSNTNGTFVNGAATTTGYVNQALNLSGGAYVSNNGMLATTSVSVASWVKNNATSTGARQVIAARGHSNSAVPSQVRYSLHVLGTTVSIMVGNAAGTGVSGASANVADWSQWHYIVGTFDINTGTSKIYIDGVLANTVTNGSFGANLNNSVGDNPRIGANGRSLSDYWSGQIDDVRIWARSISGSEVTTLYNSMIPDTTPPTVSVSSPSNGSTIAGSSVTVSASVSDAVGVVGVRFYRGGSIPIGSEDTSSPFIATLDSTALADGNYSITAVARDAAGNYATSSTSTVTVDNTIPTISSVVANPSTTSVTISFNTNEGTQSQIEYGTAGYMASTTINIDDSYLTSRSITINGLNTGTLYNFRVVAFDAGGNRRNGADDTFTTSGGIDSIAPIISSVASSTGQTTANITWATDESATSTVLYGFTTSYGNSSTSATFLLSHSVVLTGLTPNSLYHFRVSSSDSSGNISTSTDYTFITATANTAPTVTTQLASSLGQTVATLNGNITAIGGATPTTRGFAYGTSATLATTIATTSSSGSFSTGAFTGSITSLTCETTYYFRPYATNSVGTGYGSIVSFTTSACDVPASTPTLATTAATSVTQTTATLNGSVTDTGGADITVRGFQYGLTTSYGSLTTENGTFSTGSFSASASSLICNTLYHFRSYGTNSTGTAYGSDATLTTSACDVVSSGGGGGGSSSSGGGGSSNTDTTAPTVSDIKVFAGDSTALISWNTNEISTTQIEYGLTSSFGNTTVLNTSLSLAHAQTISGLQPNTRYLYRLKSKDVYGNVFTSEAMVFATGKVGSVPTVAEIKTLNTTGVDVEVTKETSAYSFTRNLTVTNTGSDVSYLQKYLNDSGYIVSVSGPGSKGNETTYFGPATRAALAKFQAAKGLPSTGFFGPMTRALLATSKISAVTPTPTPKPIISTTTPAITTPTTIQTVIGPFPASAIPPSGRYTSTLSLGSKGTEVTALQTFLANYPEPSIYPEKKITGVFDQATEAAVMRFQSFLKIKQEGELGFGIVGETTRAVVNRLLGR